MERPGSDCKANHINRHRSNWVRWHSTNTDVQAVFRTPIEAIQPRFVNDFEGN